MIELTTYGDFNCPFSAVASRRVDQLVRQGSVRVDWRAIEHDPTIPPSGVEVTDELAESLRAELDQIRGLLAAGEPDRLRLPARQVNTALATQRYAGTPAEARAEVRREIFAAHWEDARSIDDDDVLDRIGAGPADPAVVAAWRAEWAAATTPIVPVLVLPDGYVSRGLGALARLSAMLEAGAETSPGATGWAEG